MTDDEDTWKPLHPFLWKGAQMKIKMGEKVLSQNGRDVGRIERVVMDPKSDEITHVVIEKGVLFKEDRIAPVSMLGASTDKGLTLLVDEKEINELPEFKTEHFILYSGLDEALEEQEGYASPLIMYPSARLMQAGMPQIPYPPIGRRTDENIPENTVAVQDGAEVIGLDGNKVGSVEQVFMDPQLDRVTYFLISKGLLFKEHKLIPVDWVQEITEGRIRLGVDTRVIQQLPDYPRGVPSRE